MRLFLSLGIYFFLVIHPYAQEACEIQFIADRDSLRQGLYDAEQLFEICMQTGESCEDQESYTIECYEYLSTKHSRRIDKCALFLAFGKRIALFAKCWDFTSKLEDNKECTFEGEDLLEAYYLLGRCALTQKNRETSIYYYKKFLSLERKMYGGARMNSEILRSLVKTLSNSRKFKEAIYYANLWKNTAAFGIEEKSDLVHYYIELSDVYSKQGNWTKALELAKLALQNLDKEDKIATYEIYTLLAHLYALTNNIKTGFNYSQKVKKLAFELNDDWKIGKALYAYASYLVYDFKDYVQGETVLFQSAKRFNVYDEINGTKEIDINSASVSKISALLHLIAWNYIYAYNEDSDKNKLRKAEDYLERLLDMNMNSLKSSEMNYNVVRRFENTYISYQSVCLELFNVTNNTEYVEKSIYYSELFNSIDLYKKNYNDSYQSSNLSDQLRGERSNITKEIYDKKQEVDLIRSTGKFDDPQLFLLEDSIYLLKKQLRAVEKEVDFDLESFLNKQEKITDLQLLRKRFLNPDQTLVKFVAYGNLIGQYLISQDTLIFRVYEGPKVDSILHHIQVLHTAVGENSTDREHIVTHAYALYKHLLEPFEDVLTENLLIIPDGAIEKLPFELLLTEETSPQVDYSRVSFLVNRHRITYASSIWHHAELLKKKVNPKYHRIFAFAPDYPSVYTMRDSKRKLVTRLNGNEDEVEYISERFPTDMALHRKATSTYFKKHAEEYSVLHLATHAHADWGSEHLSFVVFSDLDSPDTGRIYASTLYGMKLNAEMVVLSACETGLGEWKRGEGIMSLARAFSYAGAKSVVSTLWQVSDTKSAELMGRFYDHLAMGKTKDVALQHAKQEYIVAHPGKDSHPYYWAGYRLQGNTDPLMLKASIWNKWWLLLLPVILWGIYQWQRRQSPKAPW